MMPEIIAERGIEQVAAEVPLVERRRAGEVFPRVSVGSVELTREQVAAGLYVQFAGLPELPKHFTDVELLDLLARSLDACGLAGLDDARRELETLPLDDRTAGRAYSGAYRLCVEHWYRDALCEPLGVGELVLALYASDIEVGRDRSALDRLPEVDGHLSEGVSRLGARTLVLHGDEVKQEFDHPDHRIPFTALSETYQALMPNARRRRFCYDLAVSRQWAAPRPLLVLFDEGGYAVGAVPPEDPHLIAFHRAFLPRSRRAQMEAAA